MAWHALLPGVMPPQIIRKALKDLGPEKSRRVPRGADRSSSTGTDSLQGDWPVRRWRGSWPQQWLKKRIYYKWQKIDALKLNFRNCLLFPHWKCGNEMVRFPIILLTFSNMFFSASTDFPPSTRLTNLFVCHFSLLHSCETEYQTGYLLGRQPAFHGIGCCGPSSLVEKSD